MIAINQSDCPRSTGKDDNNKAKTRAKTSVEAFERTMAEL